MATRPGSLSRSLADHHDEWCALCLNYFERDEARELHHVVNKAYMRHRFGPSLDFGWVVPTHRDRGCHGRLQRIADAAAAYFIQVLDGAQTIVDREAIARWFHERGYYWLSVLANLDTLQRPVEGADAEQQWRRREFAMTGAAGIRGGQNVPELAMAGASPDARPRLQLYLSNLQSARGHHAAARRSFDIAKAMFDSRLSAEKAVLLPGLLRREAQISRSPADAQEAVRAAESEYSENTALVLQGILAASGNRFDLVEESLERLDSRNGGMSWLYHAETQFIRALYLISTGSKDRRAIYSSLSVAQYVYVALSLQMSITPELCLQSPAGRGWDWTPGDVLRSVFSSSPFVGPDRAECLHLRRVSIQETRLLEKILDPIAGWGDGPKPGPGHLVHPR